jgi:hypothetical protein
MTRWSAKLPLAIGFAAVVLLLGGLGAWSVGTLIAGAVVASGTVEVESDRQVVQHPDGGVVGEILVRDGDTVAAGDVTSNSVGTVISSLPSRSRTQSLTLALLATTGKSGLRSCIFRHCRFS